MSRTLHVVAIPGLILGILYGLLSTSRLIPEYRARSNHRELGGVAPKQNKQGREERRKERREARRKKTLPNN